ncbi:MAG: hypothetical protein PVG43_07830 [Nitrosopumilaceae archaeon]|jgi:hypothetical protein
MPIPKDIQDLLEEQINLMISHCKVFLPFIKGAFPYSKNPTDACYNLIVGSAVLILVNQYALRMMHPTAEDFAEFGKIASKYKEQIDKFIK